MAGDRYILQLVLHVALRALIKGTPTLESSRRVPVVGLPLELICKLSTNFPTQLTFTLESTVKVNCSDWSSGSCTVSDNPAHFITSSGREITLNIRSFIATKDTGAWSCNHDSQSNTLNFLTSSSIVDWSQVTTAPNESNFPASVNETSSLSIFLDTPCAKGIVNVTWTYSDDEGASRTLSARNTRSNCNSGETKTTGVVTILGTNLEMRNKLIRINISVEHDSFPPGERYTRTKTLGPIQFPVPVKLLTLKNITTDEEIIKILKDTYLTLFCESSPSFPMVEIKWYKHTDTKQRWTSGIQSRTQDVTPVVKRTISTLAIRVTSSDNGNRYSCEGSNSNSPTPVSSHRASIDVLSPPSTPVLVPPGSVLEQTEVTLTCSSSEKGNPVCSYTWWKNDVTQTMVGSNFTFNATKDDNGAKLECQAFNDYTNMTSTILRSIGHTLHVYYKPRVAISTTDVTKNEGARLSVTCSADSNPPSPEFSWTSPESSILSTSTILTKSSLGRDDHGVYTCTAVVSASTYGRLSGSATIQVTVNYAPDITIYNVTVQEGQTLDLECQAFGRPDTYTFQPFKQYWGNTNVRSLPGSKTGATYRLQRFNVTYQDSGDYECYVHNGISNRAGVRVQTRRAFVDVQASPVYISGSRRVAVEIGESINITHSWFARPRMTRHVWTFEDGKSSGFPSSAVQANQSMSIHGRYVQQQVYLIQLSLTNVQQKNFGIYSISVCNTIGCGNTSVTLQASGPPLVPLEFTAVNSSTESVWLRWKPNFPGGSFVQHFILYYRIKDSGVNWTTDVVPQGSGNYTYKRVLGLELGTTYTFKVQSVNNHPTRNQGPFTSEVHQETKGLDQDAGVGIGAGIGVGASFGLVLLVVAVGLIYKYRRQIQGIYLPCHRKESPSSDDVPQREEDSDGNINYAVLQGRNGKSLHPYEGIALTIPKTSSGAGQKDKENPYVNTKFHRPKPAILPKPAKAKSGNNKSHEGHVYENYSQ